MARIAFGGFQHETNTFAPSNATYADFLKPGAWPGLTRGEPLFAAIKGINIPVAGFVEVAQKQGHTLLRSEEHTSELPSLMRISYAVFCLQQRKLNKQHRHPHHK